MPIKISPSRKLRTKVYDEFLGVDFSQDAILVDKRRSPYSVNMISDKSGQPEKRVGFKTLFNVEKPIYTMANGEIDKKDVIVIHANDKLYKIVDDEISIIHTGVNSGKSSIFFATHDNKTKVFIITGKEFLVWDFNEIQNVSDIAYVPTTLIAKSPKGAGTSLEAVNLLQNKRREKFLSDGVSKEYFLYSKNIGSESVEVEIKTGEETSTKYQENNQFTVDRTNGKVIFKTAPAKSSVEGEDNVFITYAVDNLENKNKIIGCNIHTFYGLGSDTRVFLTGNAEYPSYDWFSSTNDPTYFAETDYNVIGSSNTKVMGYGKIGQHLIIVKEDNNQDTTIFLRTPYKGEDDKTYFTLQGSITGVGAVSPYSFAQLVDEPLFLSRNGVYAITSNTITAERTLQNRSHFIDNKLLAEKNLENAVAHVWRNYYLIAINGNVYLLDSKQKSEVEMHSSFVYEAYFWQGINATCFMSIDDLLYFGDVEGNICVFKSNIEGMDRFSDDGRAIKAVWSTKMDDDDLALMSKTLSKKGCVLTLKPMIRSSIKIGYKTLKETEDKNILDYTAGILDFNYIDFNVFNFVSNDNARSIVIRHKIKKYVALQFYFSNEEVNEGFGIFSFIKCYTPINYIKGG